MVFGGISRESDSGCNSCRKREGYIVLGGGSSREERKENVQQEVGVQLKGV